MTFSFFSSICRQFLVDLGRLAGGLSRESVPTQVEFLFMGNDPFARAEIRFMFAAPDLKNIARRKPAIDTFLTRQALNAPKEAQSLTALLGSSLDPLATQYGGVKR